LRELIASIADRKDYSLLLTKGTQVRIFASPVARVPVPYFWSSKFEQALVLTAVFYLGNSRDGALVRRCREANCRKLFLAFRKSRVFCSHECASAASTRAYQERQANKRGS